MTASEKQRGSFFCSFECCMIGCGVLLYFQVEQKFVSFFCESLFVERLIWICVVCNMFCLVVVRSSYVLEAKVNIAKLLTKKVIF